MSSRTAAAIQATSEKLSFTTDTPLGPEGAHVEAVEAISVEQADGGFDVHLGGECFARHRCGRGKIGG
jgi:hypothetical protein